VAENTYHREVLAALLALAGIGSFLASPNKLRDGFLFFIATLGLGYRTLALTPALKIIPAEVVICLLFVFALVSTHREGDQSRRLPVWLLAMLPFWIIAWLPSQENEFPWDARLAEFCNFALIVPVFFVTFAVLRDPRCWRMVVLTFTVVGVWIASMGLLEYLYPGIAELLPGFMGNPDPNETDGGFRRASFSFFGSPTGVFICILVLPLSLRAWDWWPSPLARSATVLGVALQLAGLYVSGYRSMWLLFAVQFALYVLLRQRYALGLAALCIAFVGYSTLPVETRDRLQSLEKVLQGDPREADTSGQKRWDRATETWHYALDQPGGHGWAASGWVHSDFLQVAANQGLIAGVIFLGAYTVTLARLGIRLCRRASGLNPEGGDVADLGNSLFLSFVAVGAMLLFQGVEFLPQTMLPVWLTWALAETWLRQTATVSADRGWVPSTLRHAHMVRPALPTR
jgi:hypothetical protein